MSDRVFTKAEVVEHANNNKDRCILAIHNNIYDITGFMDEHPGGEEILTEHSVQNGKFFDCTETFEDVGHSADARDLMKKYMIGTLEALNFPSEAKKDKPAQNKTATKCEENQAGGVNWYWVLSFVAVLGAAFFYRRYYVD